MTNHDSRTRGLFGRLLFIFMGLLFAIAMSFAISFQVFNRNVHRAIVGKNFTNYAKYLANEIGAPPSTSVIDRQARELGLSIGVFSKDFNYKTSKDMPSTEKLSKLTKRNQRRHFKRWRMNIVQQNGYTYSFGIDRSLIERSPWPLIIGGLLSLLFVIIAYHLVERLFKPLYNIKRAAGEYADGHFDHEMEITGVGLLKELSQSIQDMGSHIKSMLNSKREMLLAIAHELRTPITRAKLHLEMLEDQDIKSKLSQELDEMSQQVNDILEGERLKDDHSLLKKNNVDLGKLVKEVVDRHSPGL